MNPTNNTKDGCVPVSSNCVIWQGPDIPCIGLCKGASVSDVIAKLGEELCKIMDYMKVSNYDLECLGVAACPPKDFAALIQLIITRLCLVDAAVAELNGTGGTGGSSARLGGGDDCPQCQIVIAPCFRFVSKTGDEITSMTMTDYVIAIGNKICGLVSTISTLQTAVANHETRITALEEAPDPTFTLPQVTPVCVLPAVPTDMNLVLAALEAQFCTLLGATGSSESLFAAFTKQCPNLTAQDQLSGPGQMGNITGWVANVQNLAGSLNNLWLTICDLRGSIASIQSNCCPSGCAGIQLAMTAQLEGSVLKLYLVGTIPPEFNQCAPGTTTFTISDQSGHTINYPIDLIAAMNLPGGYSVDLSVTPINLADDLTIIANPCLESATSGSTCQYALNYTAVYPGTCPTMNYIQTESTITYNGNIISGTGAFTVELWNNAGTTLVQSQTSNLSAPATLAGTFAGLTANTIYKVRVKIVPGGDGIPLYCPFVSIQTSPSTCPPPTDLVVVLNENP